MNRVANSSYEAQIDTMIEKGYDIQDINEFIDDKFESGCFPYTAIDKLTDYAQAKLASKNQK